MSDMDDNDRLTKRIKFRVEPEIYEQIDQLAAHAGVSRPGFLRLCIRLAHTTMTMQELERAGGPDDPRTTDARNTVTRLLNTLRPKPLPDIT